MSACDCRFAPASVTLDEWRPFSHPTIRPDRPTSAPRISTERVTNHCPKPKYRYGLTANPMRSQERLMRTDAEHTANAEVGDTQAAEPLRSILETHAGE